MIDKAEYEKRLARITELFSGMVRHANEQAKTRCPYKNAQNECTAKFTCRFQRGVGSRGTYNVGDGNSADSDVAGPNPADASQTAFGGSTEERPRFRCTHDGTFDYRSAWELAPDHAEHVRQTLKSPPSESTGTVGFGDRSCPAMPSQTLFDHADVIEVAVPSSCGRTGLCHECVVHVKSGAEALNRPTEEEAFLRDDYRLACQACVKNPVDDIRLALLRRTPQILTAQERRTVSLDPAVTRREDEVFYEDESIGAYRGHIFGLAIDLGTTTVVVELVDLESGESRCLSSFENPQRFGGSDVLNRISYDGGEYHGELQKAVINSLNGEIRDICQRTGVSRHDIYELVVVGNATMRDLFFGLDVQPIGQKPYKSITEEALLSGHAETTALNESARKLRVMANKNARVFGVPLVASHVGGDVAADLVALDLDSATGTSMLVDIGTNTEVIIGNKDRLVSASCPAGPAFEGGLVTFGMPGCDGAIESARYRDGSFHYETIGGGRPEGICGSGLIDILAELRRAGLMTPKGVFAEKAREITIARDEGITLSRQDASHLAQAKAANYCGQFILMRHFGITPDEVERMYLAGGFANYINVEAAVEIGFLAPVPAERIEKVGNAASQGARELLLSRSKRIALEKVVQAIEHVELETTPDFFDVFVDGCMFDPMTVSS